MKPSSIRQRASDEETCSGSPGQAHSELPYLGDGLLANRYRIRYLLGRGGTGSVYAARDLTLDRDVAVKFLPARSLTTPPALSTLRREVDTGRNFCHPNIVRTFHSARLPDGGAYIVMELIKGSTLRHHQRHTGALTVRSGLDVVRQIASALEVVHAAGIVHSDLTPSNIILSEKADGHWHSTLVDFGATHPLSPVAHLSESTEIVIGTARYLSPEQFAGINGDIRSDVYSLAVILFEILTGRTPLHSLSTGEIALKHAHRCAMPGLRSFRPDLPVGLEQIVAKALRTDRATRLPTAASLACAIADIEAGATTESMGITPSLDDPAWNDRTVEVHRRHDGADPLSGSITSELQPTRRMDGPMLRFG
jgi:eukaryotic-like serine/threonine-protein kinase